MKQIFIKKGKSILVETPPPTIKNGFVKIKVIYSSISAGTELTTVQGTSSGSLSRVYNDPSKIYKVIDIFLNQGLKNTKNKILSTSQKLNSIGYSVAGKIIEVGANVDNLFVGDLVAAGGGGFAVHAEIVVVPKNLVVKVPSGLDLRNASTGTIGAIALHGVRRASLNISEYGIVYGVGLIGLLCLQILKSSGVMVACIDINDEKLLKANELGADLIINTMDEDPVLAVENWTSGHGADAVLFTASTKTDEPLSQAFRMCRRKGRVVLVGVSGMNINRNDIYQNEIDFLISTSYGPGRYDEKYELGGIDYPYAYVRWTENRNIEAYLHMLNHGKINLEKLRPKVYQLNRISNVYESIQSDPDNHILTHIQFEEIINFDEEKPIKVNALKNRKSGKICIGLVGVGNFASSTLLPIIYSNSNKFRLKTIVNSSGDKALNAASQFHAEFVSSELEDILNDEEINLLMICTRHLSHSEMVLKGLKHNKHVYCEKPLCTTMEELSKIEGFYTARSTTVAPILMVGFNRRFSFHATKIKNVISQRNSPLFIHYRMNAGFVPYDSWIHNDGGRIIGEACHIIDLVIFLVNSHIVEYSVNDLRPINGKFLAKDNKSISLKFTDGSIAVIDYFSCGSPRLSKEYMEIHFDNKSIIMDDYKTLNGYGIDLRSKEFKISQKGHLEEWIALYYGINSGSWPIPLENLLEVTRLSILTSF